MKAELVQPDLSNKDEILAEVTDFADRVNSEMGKGNSMVQRLKVIGCGSDVVAKIEAQNKVLETNYNQMKAKVGEENTNQEVYTPLMQKCIELYKALKKWVNAGKACAAPFEGPKKKKQKTDDAKKDDK